MAALEVQVQSECSHLAALRVRVQGSKKKCKCKECKKIGKSDHGDVHIASPTTTSPHTNCSMILSVMERLGRM